MKMSGEAESATDFHLKKLEKELDDLVGSIGITYIKDQVSIDALNMDYQDLAKIHPQECLILNYKLHQYGLYVQSVHNRAENIKNWANHNLNVVVGKEGHAYGNNWTKFEERRVMVVAGNSFAKALSDIYLKASSKATELYGISTKIEKIAFALYELSKRKENHG